MEPEELTIKDHLIAPRTKIKSMSQITDCSSNKNHLHKQRISTRNNLNSTDKEVHGFIDWPIEKIVEQYQKNPFFRQKVKAVVKRRDQLTETLLKKSTTTLSSKFKHEEQVILKWQQTAELRRQLDRLNLIIKSCNL